MLAYKCLIVMHIAPLSSHICIYMAISERKLPTICTILNVYFQFKSLQKQ